MAEHVGTSLIESIQVSEENEENSDPSSNSDLLNMKTIPQIAQNMYPSLKNSQDLDVNMTGPMATRSPIRTAKRRGLATLQPSAAVKGSVVGGLRSESVFTDAFKQKKISNTFSWTVKKDSSPSLSRKHSRSPSPTTTSCSASTQTDLDDWLTIEETREKDDLAEEALSLMRSEPSKEQYYKEIAEERREALEETLKENEELYEEVDSLKEKCERLEKALSEAENYKLLYISMLESKECCNCEPKTETNKVLNKD